MTLANFGRLDDLLKQLDEDDENLDEEDFDYDEFIQRRVTQSQVAGPLNENQGNEDEDADEEEDIDDLIDENNDDFLSHGPGKKGSDDSYGEAVGHGEKLIPGPKATRPKQSESAPSANDAGLWLSDAESDHLEAPLNERDRVYADAGIDRPEEVTERPTSYESHKANEDIERVNHRLEREIGVHVSRHTVAEATVSGFASLLGQRTPPPTPKKAKPITPRLPQWQHLTSYVASSPPRSMAEGLESDSDSSGDDLEIVPSTEASRMNVAQRDQVILGQQNEMPMNVGDLTSQLLSKQRDQSRARRELNLQPPNPPRNMKSLLEHERQVTTDLARSEADKYVPDVSEPDTLPHSHNAEAGAVAGADANADADKDQPPPIFQDSSQEKDLELETPTQPTPSKEGKSQEQSQEQSHSRRHCDETQEDLNKIKEMGLTGSQELAEVRRLFLIRQEREKDRSEDINESENEQTPPTQVNVGSQAKGSSPSKKRMVLDDSSDSDESEEDEAQSPKSPGDGVGDATEVGGVNDNINPPSDNDKPAKQLSESAVEHLVDYVQQESRKRKHEVHSLKKDNDRSFIKPTRISANPKNRAFFESCTGSFVKKPKAAVSKAVDVASIHESLKFIEPADHMSTTDDSPLSMEESVVLPRARPLPSLKAAPPPEVPNIPRRSVARIQSELAPSGPKTVQILKSTSRPRQPVESRPRRVMPQLKPPRPVVKTSHVRGNIFRRNWDN